MHRMELLLNEAQDAILSYDSKSLNSSVESLSSVNTLSDQSPIEIIKESIALGLELQLSFLYLVLATVFYSCVAILDYFGKSKK